MIDSILDYSKLGADGAYGCFNKKFLIVKISLEAIKLSLSDFSIETLIAVRLYLLFVIIRAHSIILIGLCGAAAS